MREVAPDYYFLQPGSTRSGVRAFVDDMFDILHTPGLVPRAREAAQACEAEPVTNPNAFQEKLRAAVFDLYRRTVRPHPRVEDMAAAFADTIVAPFTPERIETALRRAERLAAASEHLWEVERAREREEAASGQDNHKGHITSMLTNSNTTTRPSSTRERRQPNTSRGERAGRKADTAAACPDETLGVQQRCGRSLFMFLGRL
jgi:hypothetical protein